MLLSDTRSFPSILASCWMWRRDEARCYLIRLRVMDRLIDESAGRMQTLLYQGCTKSQNIAFRKLSQKPMRVLEGHGSGRKYAPWLQAERRPKQGVLKCYFHLHGNACTIVNERLGNIASSRQSLYAGSMQPWKENSLSHTDSAFL